jgi:sirohydrochlorin cobaltochelatase
VKAILLFSHGSVLCGAGENLKLLARHMQEHGDAGIVEVGYLNYSEPLFEQAFETCVRRGATEIVVAPYFLVAGKFVKADLPPQIEKMRARYPQIRVLVAQAMRFHSALAQAISNCANRALPPAQWRDILDTAPQFCRKDPQCPLFDSARCPASSNGIEKPESASREALTPDAFCLSPGSHRSSLLVMVHGSPRPESNCDMFAVVDVLRARNEFATVEVGFMECNEPTIPQAIARCVGQGAQRVVAVPYFLHTGNHVADDLPTLLEEAQAQYPEVEFLMGDYLGHDAAIADVLRDRVLEANRVFEATGD